MLAADAIAQTLTAELPDETVLPFADWSPDWQVQAKAAYPDAQSLGMVAPQTVAHLSKVMTLVHRNHWQVLVAGQGSKLGWGALARQADLLVSTRHMNRLTDHAIADMTVTVGAGMRFADLQTLLAQQHQWLPLDPSHPHQATLGGILATRDAGSLRHRYGSLRDLCLGLTLVRADGQVAKAGGRVVKNVAGYDLMKLLTGSFGTLGIVAEMTLRVYPLPEACSTMLIQGEPAAIAPLTADLLRSTLTPAAVDILTAETDPAEIILAIQFQSLPEGVAAQIERVQAMTQALEVQVKVQTETAAAQEWPQTSEETQILCQIGVLAAQAVASLRDLQRCAADHGVALQGRIHAGSGLGKLRLVSHETDDVPLLTQLRSRCEQAGGFLSVLEAPTDLKKRFEVWGYSGNALDAMHKLKKQFDPQGLLNPGRFVGGI
ncbi:MAG: FAD-binding oxidoreductase [Thermosynechococcaceae cyanobacterium]